MKLVLCAATLLSVLAASPSIGRAEDKEAARREYAEGTRRYDLNEFGPALEAFRRAYLAYEEPAFLYNIAQCHRQLNHKAEAIQFYRSYLRKLPAAPNRAEVERIVATLEAAVARDREIEAARAAAPTMASSVPATTTAPATHAAVVTPDALIAREAQPRRTPIYKKWWLWTAVGVVIAGAATGLAVGLTSQSRTEASLMPVSVTR